MNPNTRSARQPFTLIELLVVIAIISILAAMLLPALAQARARAMSIRCASQLKNIALAYHMYSDENDNFVVFWSVMTDGAQGAWESPPFGNKYWVDLLTPYVGETSYVWTSGAGQYWYYLNNHQNESMFYCPSYDGQRRRTSAYTPYGMHQYGPGGRNWNSTTHRGYRKVQQILDPTTQLLIADSPGVGATSVRLHRDVGALGWRHLGRVNVIYADGHVENNNIQELFAIPYPQSLNEGPWRCRN